MTEQEKVINQFENRCKKSSYELCILYHNICDDCIKYYYAARIVKLNKKIKKLEGK